MADLTWAARIFGRSRRREFWLSGLAMVGLYIAGRFTIGLLATNLILLPVQLLIYIRRLHDFDARGWWSLTPFAINFGLAALPATLAFAFPTLVITDFRVYEVVMVGATSFIFLLALGVTPGTPRANRFGPGHTRDRGVAEVFD